MPRSQSEAPSGGVSGAASPGLSRRSLLLLGAAGVAAGLSGCDGAASSPGLRGPTPAGPSTPVTQTAGPVPWQRLATQVRGYLWRPGRPGYDAARLVENPRFDDARPLAVLSVATAEDVSRGLLFAREHRVPLALRSGGHSYPGWSAGGAPGSGMPRSLVIDCRGLGGIRFDGTTVTVGAGLALAEVYAALAARGRAIAAGSCPTVGISGLTLGGGVGVLTRAYGLTCDALTGLEIVTADGRLRRVDAQHEPDLFWALRGGGGGHVGVVTSLRFATVPAPVVRTFFLTWPVALANSVIEAWQSWAPGADARLWSTLKVLGGGTHPGGPQVLLSGTWTGPGDPDLGGLLRHCPPPSSRFDRTRGYGDAMAAYAGCAIVPVDRCHTGPGGALQREAFAATSHVGYTTLPATGVAALLEQVHRAQGSGLKEAGISMDALGGRVRDLGPGETAFVHRQALMTVQYTATYTGDRAADAAAFVHGFRAAMTPSWGDHAYVNYADPTLANPSRAYFGANADRLAAVRGSYDPEGVFTQPQGW